MNKEKLEFHLNRGNTFGYNTVNNKTILGWVIVSKRFPGHKFFERFKEEDNPEEFKAQMKIKTNHIMYGLQN